MSTLNLDHEEESKLALSWRRLHLSKAKLKASSKTSALFSGFAMVAMVEASLSDQVPSPLLVAYSVCTTLLVAVHMLALMISTCILPHIEAISFTDNPTAVNESPHERLHAYIELSWAFSTVFGILLFLSELAILCWVKLYEFSYEAALSSSVILIPLSVVFVGFAVHFYRKLATHQYEKKEEGLRELEVIMKGLQDDGDDGELEKVTTKSPSKHINGPRTFEI